MTNTVKTLCIAIVLAGLVTSSASQASAQAPMQGPMPGMGMMGRGGPGMGMMDRGMMRLMAECPMMGTDLATHTDGRIAFLKAELAITDSQKAAWDGYAEALTKNLRGMQVTRQTMIKSMEATSPVERLENHITAMESRVTALREIKPALVALYNSLSDEQKRKADQLLTGMGCMM